MPLHCIHRHTHTREGLQILHVKKGERDIGFDVRRRGNVNVFCLLAGRPLIDYLVKTRPN